MSTPTDRALDDVARYQASKTKIAPALAMRTFTSPDIMAYAPCSFNIDKVDPLHQYDVFLADADNADITGWHLICTEECAEWALTLQNMVRKERPWLRVKIWSKPRCHA